MQAETWRAVPGWPEYEVSDMGNVRRDGRNRSLQRDARGYMRVCLWRRPARELWLVHRLVMLSFAGESDLDVNHINGTTSDNRLCNLEYATRSENVKHAYDTGLRVAYTDSANDPEIVALARAGIARKVIAERFRISKSAVAWILRGRNWKQAVAA